MGFVLLTIPERRRAILGAGRTGAGRIAIGVGVGVALIAVLAQVLLPSLAATRVRARVGRYGNVYSVHVSAFPAVELLWGHADSIDVSAGTLTVTPAQISSLLSEARSIDSLAVRAGSVVLRVPVLLPSGLAVGDVRLQKRGSSITAGATVTQAQLDAALPSGVHVEPIASGGGSVQARVSGGLFGIGASLTALVHPFAGRLIAEPSGIPFGGVASVTLFSDPRLSVRSVGVRLISRRPAAYRLSLEASLR